MGVVFSREKNVGYDDCAVDADSSADETPVQEKVIPEEDVRAMIVELSLIKKTSLLSKCKDVNGNTNYDEIKQLADCMISTGFALKRRFHPTLIYGYGHRLFLCFFGSNVGNLPYGGDESKGPSIMAAFASTHLLFKLTYSFPSDATLTEEHAMFMAESWFARSNDEVAEFIGQKAKHARWEHARRVARKAQKNKRAHPYDLDEKTLHAIDVDQGLLSPRCTIGFFIKNKTSLRKSLGEDGLSTIVRSVIHAYEPQYPIYDYDNLWPAGLGGGADEKANEATIAKWVAEKSVDTPGGFTVLEPGVSINIRESMYTEK